MELLKKIKNFAQEKVNTTVSSQVGAYHTIINFCEELEKKERKKKKWFKPSHRPNSDKDSVENFSVSVLLYSPKMDLHTIGWFDFELDKWMYLGDEEFKNFVWCYLETNINLK